VIAETHPYYYFREMAAFRQQLLGKRDSLLEYRGRCMSVRQAVRKHGLSQKKGELLFRLAHGYKLRSMLLIGSSAGLAPLYLTGYTSSDLLCITLEREARFAAITNAFLKKEDSRVKIFGGSSYEDLLPGALQTLRRVDCLFISAEVEAEALCQSFDRCLAYVSDEAVCILDGIRLSPARYRCWQQFCRHPKATASVDLYSCGLVFFHPQLHQCTYKSILR
jgi:predicted O-methyltransferase YrrM